MEKVEEQSMGVKSKKRSGPGCFRAGFSLVELMIALCVIGIMASASAPAILAWLPNYRLKSAARDLYSAMQNARLLAVRENTTVRVVFNTGVNPGSYLIDINGNGVLDQPGEYNVDLAGYGSGVDFGFPGGLVDWNGNQVLGSITFAGAQCSYNSNGTSGNGTVYLVNGQLHIVYAITTVTSGAVKLRKYNGIQPYDQNNWIE